MSKFPESLNGIKYSARATIAGITHEQLMYNSGITQRNSTRATIVRNHSRTIKITQRNSECIIPESLNGITSDHADTNINKTIHRS